MARCLRCNAGNEWIEGAVPPEPSEMTARIQELEDRHDRDVNLWTIKERFRLQLDHLAATNRLHPGGCETCDAVRLDIARYVQSVIA